MFKNRIEAGQKLKIGFGLVLLFLILGSLGLGLAWRAGWWGKTATDKTGPPDEVFDATEFRNLAFGSEVPCADQRNDLFIIDNRLVFWLREGSCPDNRYSYTLYGATPSDVLCSYADSIAGPRKSCLDERFEGMFENILANLEEEDLGLGAKYRVKPL